ncbi:MAG: hypothetical protein GY832_03805 [Chloroflexi bacterium]|nr:hypothetical protein [Chloroflexota bacterium]
MHVRIEGLKALIERIETIEQLRHVLAALNAGALHIKEKIATYPPVPGRPQPFVSPKQRRGFFAHLRSEDIEVPWRRGISPGSQRMGARWTIKKSANGMRYSVGNNASYARLVQGPRLQTRYHATTGWQTTTQVAASEGPTVVALVREGLQKDVNG